MTASLAADWRPLGLTPAFELRVRLAPPQEIGAWGGGLRRVVPILGGAVDGPRLQGEVLPGGADWQTVRPDGVTVVEARYVLKLADGTLVGVSNRGLREAAPDVAARITAGEVVEPSLYRFITTPMFEAPDGPHAWLGRTMFAARGERLPDLVRLQAYAIG